MGMLHLVEVAMFAIVMDMAVKQKASVTCRLGSVSAKTIQRVIHAAGARRVIMGIPGRYVVQDSCIIAYLYVIVCNTQSCKVKFCMFSAIPILPFSANIFYLFAYFKGMVAHAIISVCPEDCYQVWSHKVWVAAWVS
jgi:hypothetical protein